MPKPARKKPKRVEGTKMSLDEYRALKERPCEDCGGAFPHKAMHWHHLDPKLKTASVSAMISTRNREEIQKEIEKCVLLCANCHALR